MRRKRHELRARRAADTKGQEQPGKKERRDSEGHIAHFVSERPDQTRGHLTARVTMESFAL